MKTYQTAKTVEAGKILSISQGPGFTILHLDGDNRNVATTWLERHTPGIDAAIQQGLPWTADALIGGYFVQYPDGYTSWSPAEPFEVSVKDAEELVNRGLPVAGYKAAQPPEAIAVVNRLKALEERVLREIDNLTAEGRFGPENGAFADQRSLAAGRTYLQTGFMWLARAIFQPGRVTLPEDGGELFNRDGLNDQGNALASDAKGD